MSATCTNCGSAQNCSCQSRIASDGTQVCVNCLSSYEIALQQKNQLGQITVPPNNSTDPVITGIVYNNFSN